MANLTKEQRDKLPDEDFGDPQHRAYPITDNEDVVKASMLLHHTRHPGGQDALKKRIIKIAKRKNLELPQTWQDEEKSMYNTQFVAEFALETSGRDDGEFVVRPAPLVFRAGNYPDKGFDMSPEELARAVAEFKPVDLDLEHKATVLNGKLGQLTKVELANDGWTITGEARIPKWLDAILGPDERKLSAAFDRQGKLIIGCSLVRNPRVSDATLMAAFAQFDMTHRRETTAGQAIMRQVHDLTAGAGAGCIVFNGTCPFTGEEMNRLKMLHDLSSDNGLNCAAFKSMASKESGNTYPDNRLMKTTRTSNPMPAAPPVNKDSQESGNMYPKERDEGDIHDNKRLNKSGEVQPAQSSGVLAQMQATRPETGWTPSTSPIAQNSADFSPAPLHAPTGVTSFGTTPAQPMTAFSTTPTVPVPAAAVATDQHIGQLQMELARRRQETEMLRAQMIAAEAANFAATEIASGRSLPAERNNLVAQYAQAAKDDAMSNEAVVFNNQRMTRVEMLKQSQAQRQPTNLTREVVTDPTAVALFNNQPSPQSQTGNLSDVRRKELLSHTALGRSVLVNK